MAVVVAVVLAVDVTLAVVAVAVPSCFYRSCGGGGGGGGGGRSGGGGGGVVVVVSWWWQWWWWCVVVVAKVVRVVVLLSLVVLVVVVVAVDVLRRGRCCLCFYPSFEVTCLSCCSVSFARHGHRRM